MAKVGGWTIPSRILSADDLIRGLIATQAVLECAAERADPSSEARAGRLVEGMDKESVEVASEYTTQASLEDVCGCTFDPDSLGAARSTPAWDSEVVRPLVALLEETGCALALAMRCLEVWLVAIEENERFEVVGDEDSFVVEHVLDLEALLEFALGGVDYRRATGSLLIAFGADGLDLSSLALAGGTPEDDSSTTDGRVDLLSQPGSLLGVEATAPLTVHFFLYSNTHHPLLP